MSNSQKIQIFQKKIGISKITAQKHLTFFNWLNEWDIVLNILYKTHQIKTEGKVLFMSFCIELYEYYKMQPRDYLNSIISNN